MIILTINGHWSLSKSSINGGGQTLGIISSSILELILLLILSNSRLIYFIIIIIIYNDKIYAQNVLISSFRVYISTECMSSN